ncbi:Methyltransferase domain-containing protein [Chitinophaga jiangningensis]|uniref:Methyltransferase domain-containing protein n=1 Tax=Chitinophaga jiangningensis TaxID=1419482 RepID=A0A1M7C0B0_9BACT|nr:class I SAM-dependent methyltransferase [Chitinophaga jiangningensis]SHL60685.1 Methyltransferase domain-containing protein [Chitinophaga jiangningensis]
MATLEPAKKQFTPAMGYHFLTGLYDVTVSLTMPENRIRQRLVTELAPQSREAILEFGFGTGQNLIRIHQRNAHTNLRGLDIDPKVKALAAKKLAKFGLDLPLDLYDGGVFPYADNSFDKVVSSLVFHQLSKEGKFAALAEIQRVLKPGGRLVIGDWGQPSSYRMRMAFYTVQLLDGFRTTTDNVKGLMPVYMEMQGFTDVQEPDYIDTWLGTYAYYTGICQKASLMRK